MTFDHINRLVGRPVSHFGYAVDDLHTATKGWAEVGVGPFIHLEHPEFDVVESEGEPAVFDHSAAFSWWGDFGIELHQIHKIEPAAAAEMMKVGAGCTPNHVAIETTTPEEDSARLEELGMPLFLRCEFGPIEDRLHYAPFLGHAIEIHRASEYLTDFWRMVREASEHWDGAETLRPLALAK